ncbi:hypothetical protein BVZ80_00337B, partial [Haemophilus influenzae]
QTTYFWLFSFIHRKHIILRLQKHSEIFERHYDR